MLRTQDYYRHHVARVTRNRNHLWNDVNRESYLGTQVEGKEGRYIFRGGYPEVTTRFSKVKPLDCGVPGCPMCHADKLKKRRFSINDATVSEFLGEWGVLYPEEFLTNQF